MRIPPIFEQQKQPTAPNYLQYLSIVLMRMWTQLAQVVNYGIELYATRDNGTNVAANVKGYVWRGNLSAAPLVIPHNLGYAPVGFVVLRLTSATAPYFVSSTKTAVTVSCNGVATDVMLLII